MDLNPNSINMKRKLCSGIYLAALITCPFLSKAQYVQPERDDTIRLYAKAPFDSLAAQHALAPGTAAIN